MAATTRSRRHIHAPPARVYHLLVDGDAVRRWKVPDGMSSQVHVFEPRAGGAFRVSLTYDAADAQGKTSAHTDTYHGHFVSLAPDSQVVEVMAFETADPALSGQMTVTYTLTPSGNGTDLLVIHEGLPEGVAPADNEVGWEMSLNKLATLAEASSQARSA